MKKVLMTVMCASAALLSFAQDRQSDRTQDNRQTHTGNRNVAPTAVQQAWQRDHAGEANATWRQNNGQWQAHYQDPTTHRSADSYYDRSGRQLDTHREWNSSDMPQEYQQHVNRRYHNNGNYSMTRIERPHHKEVYQLQMHDKGKRKTMYTDANGNEIRYREPHRND